MTAQSLRTAYGFYSKINAGGERVKKREFFFGLVEMEKG